MILGTVMLLLWLGDAVLALLIDRQPIRAVLWSAVVLEGVFTLMWISNNECRSDPCSNGWAGTLAFDVGSGLLAVAFVAGAVVGLRLIRAESRRPSRRPRQPGL